jgi:predicted component of type VI protein secretion system
MTTSKLLSHVGGLNGHDLTVLRDFALEAPWEWRRALDELLDAKETVSEVDALKEELEAAKEELEELRSTMKEQAAALEVVAKNPTVVGNEDLLEEITSIVRALA